MTNAKQRKLFRTRMKNAWNAVKKPFARAAQTTVLVAGLAVLGAGCGGNLNTISVSEPDSKPDKAQVDSGAAASGELNENSRKLKCGSTYSFNLKTSKKDGREFKDVSVREYFDLADITEHTEFGPLKSALLSYDISEFQKQPFLTIRVSKKDLNDNYIEITGIGLHADYNGSVYTFRGEYNLLYRNFDAISFFPYQLSKVPDGVKVEFRIRTAHCADLPKYCQVTKGLVGDGKARKREDADMPVIFDERYQVVADESDNLSIKDLSTGEIVASFGNKGGVYGDYKIEVEEDGMKINGVRLRDFYVLYECVFDPKY
jgi:hypothetical protein